MEIKLFQCTYCNKFRGNRFDVRKHLRDVHNVKGKQIDPMGGVLKPKHYPSKLSEFTVEVKR